MRIGWVDAVNNEIFRRPLYFDDFHKSMRFNSLPWIWIDGCDIDRFALATGDFNPLHFNNSFAATTVLGGLAVHGELVVNTLFGALHTVDFWHGTLEALLEKYVKFILPVRPGDRVKHYLHITETKESKKYPDKGIVRFEFFTENQRYENVAEGWFCVLMRKNPANIKKKEAD